jgi:hypothetical protein
MQLINNKQSIKKTTKPNLKALLTTATCTLLGGSAQAATEENWQFETALMQYAEVDRVMATEAIIAAKKAFGNDETLSLKLTIDALTGASPSGAVVQAKPQTFTRPSGNGQYIVAAEETPLDDTFKDTRVQFTGQWTQPLLQNYVVSVGGNLSKEYDYLSASVNGNVARNFNQKNTTLSAGMAYAYDVIEPEGGITKPLTVMVTNDFGSDNFEQSFEDSRQGSDESKSTLDLLFGLTQVINRRMIVQLNYSFSTASGYLTDPFKVISSVNTMGETQKNLYENRPDKRTKHAFFGQTKYHFDRNILDASYRFMTDDWEIDSHTFDMRYLVPLTDGHFIEPHFRVYSQSAAEFYQPFLTEGSALPQYMSADYRIGELDAYTVGLKYGLPMGEGANLAFRLEYYHQAPKSNGTEAIGMLKELELYEQVDAIIAQVTYSF